MSWIYADVEVGLTVFDIETDGLAPTKIWCLSYDLDGQCHTLTDYQEMRQWLLSQHQLIGHNIIRYDVPALERLLDIKIEATLIDTLALSWYLYPERPRHGLAQWGETFGVPKPPIDDWENLELHEYVHRCEEDVKINLKLWKKQSGYLNKLYADSGWDRIVRYLSFKMDCAAEQERSRWLVDAPRCERCLGEWVPEAERKRAELALQMPRVPSLVKRTKPKKPYKQNGEVSAAGARWFNLLREQGLPEIHEAPVKEQVGDKDPNPGSHVQIKDWLFSLGWVPETFKYVRDKETNEFRKIPQVYQKDSPEVCPSVAALFPKAPALRVLDGLSVLEHRISILQGFLDNRDAEGYVKAEIQGFTNTLRFKHTVVVNLPGIDKPYGGDCRGCLIAPEGYELCGSDQAALEDKTKQHYMYDYDPEYVKEMQVEGFCPHIDIAVQAAFITKQEGEDHISGKRKQTAARKRAKPVNYGCVYGVGAATLSREMRSTEYGAKKLIDVYWRRNWAVRAVAEACVVKVVNGQKWLLNPVSKFWYSLRAEKDRFSTLNQGTGVYCFDTWVRCVRKRRPQLTAQFHDEVVLCIKRGFREQCEHLLHEAQEEVNDLLKLNVKLGCSVDFGDSYAEIH